MTPGEAAAGRIDREREAIAREVTGRLYGERPGLLARWGERGREKCLQDVRYTLEHLAPAVSLGSPPLFARYAAWCDEVLRARGIETADLRRSLELVGEVLRDRLPEEERGAALRAVRAGVDALAEEVG